MNTIPAFLCIDVEPDIPGPPGREPSGWDGFQAVYGELERLRGELEPVTGASVNFSWYFRMDPQMAALYSRADYAASAHQDRVERLAALGDRFGLHIHPERWSDDRDRWIDDYADRAWNLECIEQSVAAYARFFGEPPARQRYGSAFIHNDYIELLERLGMRVDLTPERRYLPEARRGEPRDAQGRPEGGRTGGVPDCTRMPRRAYRPAHDDPLTADDRHGRDFVMIPLTATRIPFSASPVRRIASRLKHPRTGTPWRVMYLSGGWPDPQRYWDLVARSISSMSAPYVALGLRTNGPNTQVYERAQRVLDALPSHPIAPRLRFMDPLEAAPSLLAPSARAGLAFP